MGRLIAGLRVRFGLVVRAPAVLGQPEGLPQLVEFLQSVDPPP